MGGRLGVLARAGRENFPVAPFFLPAGHRRDLLAIYGFARLVDDVGDEAATGREALLDQVESDVRRLYEGGAPRLSLVRDLTPLVTSRGVPITPWLNLIEANRRDQRISRYPTAASLYDYCTLSANPVGRLVLHAFDASTPERVALSDDICTGLQVVEHCQDVAEDYARGRVYLPQEDLAHFGVPEADLGAPPASAAVADLVAFEVARAGSLLTRGAPLVGTLRGFPRLATAGFVAGGRAACAAITAAGCDVLSAPRRPRRRRLVGETLRLLVGGGRWASWT